MDNSLYTHRLDYVHLHYRVRPGCMLTGGKTIRFLFAIALRSVVNAQTGSADKNLAKILKKKKFDNFVTAKNISLFLAKDLTDNKNKRKKKTPPNPKRQPTSVIC